MNTKFSKTYHGFESTYDLERDLYEMWEHELKDVPSDFTGKLQVTIEYIENEGEENETES